VAKIAQPPANLISSAPVPAIAVGLLGLGNVGSGVVKLLGDNAAAIAARLGSAVEVRRVLVREVDKPRLAPVDSALVTRDVADVLGDPEIKIIVELIGGEEPARAHVLEAFARGKHVVTANKLLLAKHADELHAAAEAANVDLFYEASVCGGVPVLRALREGLASDRIDQLLGIVNGTSNFILTKMTDERRAFDDVLREAQAEGYAEADPSLDVDGHDAHHKLAILVALSFATRAPLAKIYREGIGHIAPVDIAYADRFGYKIKPLAIAREVDGQIEARVHPTLVPKRWLLAGVDGVYNAVYVSSYALGHSMYYGRGAGMMPTAVAVVSDIIEICRDIQARAPGTAAGRLRRAPTAERPFRDIGELVSRYYFRFSVLDRPGVLAQIAGILGDHAISISEVVQEGKPPGERPVTIVVTTHAARERNVEAALAGINRLTAVVEKTRLLRILE
jgi:homoserine dehydrogenase